MRTATSLARALNPGCVRMNVGLVIGAAGAVASYWGMGLSDTTPPVLTAPGIYTITLDSLYAGPMRGFNGSVSQLTGVAPLSVVPTTAAPQTSYAVVIETRVAAGTPTNPASGNVVTFEIILDETGAVAG